MLLVIFLLNLLCGVSLSAGPVWDRIVEVQSADNSSSVVADDLKALLDSTTQGDRLMGTLIIAAASFEKDARKAQDYMLASFKDGKKDFLCSQDVEYLVTLKVSRGPAEMIRLMEERFAVVKASVVDELNSLSEIAKMAVIDDPDSGKQVRFTQSFERIKNMLLTQKVLMRTSQVSLVKTIKKYIRSSYQSCIPTAKNREELLLRAGIMFLNHVPTIMNEHFK